MVDLYGPDADGASPTLTTTSDVTSPVAGDTWFEDCVSGSAGTGTPIVAKWLNKMMQQMRVAVRASAVPLSNSYDNMLSWAMQSGYVNWINYYTGSANALVGNADNAPIFIAAGTVVRGIVTTATNTGAVTFNWSGLGVQPVVRNDGTACTGGEIVTNERLCLLWDGTSWVIISPTPFSFVLPQLSQIDVQTFDASGTWTKPAGFAAASLVMVEMWGGGGGGSSPGLGGNGAAYERFYFYLGQLPGSCSVVIGAGGLGSDNSSGAVNLATEGGKTFFAYGLYGNCFVANGGPSMYTQVGGAAQAVTPYIGSGGRGGDAVLITTNGGNTIYGGAGGAGASGPGIPGTSVFGGAGGAYVAGVGSVPGGGGGCNVGGARGGDGGHGRCIVTTMQA